MWCLQLLRPMKLGFASVWAVAMILVGLQLLLLGDPKSELIVSFSVFAIAGGHFVFMFLVADDLCPKAPMFVTGLLELLTGGVSLGALVWCVIVWFSL